MRPSRLGIGSYMPKRWMPLGKPLHPVHGWRLLDRLRPLRLHTSFRARGLRGLQQLNATTAVDYTRCVFQKVPRATCEIECGDSHQFYDGPTASRAEAFALCDRDPDCDAVQQYDGSKEITNGWALPCDATTCYMKCRDLGEDGCGRTMVSDRRRLDDACYKTLFEHVYTCRPHEEIRFRSPVAFSLCIIAAIFSGHLVALAGVKLGALLGYKKGPCTLLGWSLFSWFSGAFFVTEGFGWWAGYFGPTSRLGDGGGCDEGLLGAAIGIHSAAGSLLVLALLGMLRWRNRREVRVDAFVPKKPTAQLRVRVTCPADGYAGKPITVRTPDGSEACASIPEGCAPGETFTILVRRSSWPGKWSLVPAATPPNGADYVPAHAAAGYYVGCSILPLPLVSCMSANGPDELRECCLLFPSPFGWYQEWRRDGQTNWFKEVGGERWKDLSAGNHNKTGCTIRAAKLNCCTRRGTSSDVESGEAVPAVETVLREVMGTVVAAPAVEETVSREVMGTVFGAPALAPELKAGQRLLPRRAQVLERGAGPGLGAQRGRSRAPDLGDLVGAVEETVSREVMGTVVGEPAREPPPLHDIVDALKRNLALDGTWPEVVDAACLQLGVAPTGSLQEKADACWRAMEE